MARVRFRIWNNAAIVLAIAGLCSLSGCGPDEEVRPPLNIAQGTLTINSEPAAGAMLVFQPVDNQSFDSRGTRPRANVDADGVFEVTTYQSGDGAPAGDYNVGVLWFKDPDSSSPWDKLQGRYADPATTGIEVTINEGANLLDPIEISGARVVEERPRDPTDFDQVD